MSLKEYNEAGMALADTPPDQPVSRGATMEMVPVLAVVPSLTNPRKRFDQVKLQALADDIQANGVMQSVLVRPLPGNRLANTFDFRRQGTPLPIYELVAGERRYRASRLAGIDSMPVMVKTLTDDEVLGIQLAENLLRDDLTPMEEAEGFRNWMEHSKLTAVQVAGRVKKSKRHVFNRLALLDLNTEARTAFEAGTIQLCHALPIALIPDGKLQAKALEKALQLDHKGEQPSAREFGQWVSDNVMKRLASASFDRDDLTLHATAGACQACPKRTGANPDLFSHVTGADICTDPACYDAKAETHHQRVIAIAQKKGMKVIDGKEAKKLFPANSSEMKGYTRLDTKRSAGLESGLPPESLRDMMGTNPEGAVLVEHPTTHELIAAVPTAVANKVLVERGVVKPPKKASALDRIAQLQSEHDRRLPRVVSQAIETAVADKIRALPDGLAADLISAELVRAWLYEEVDTMDAEDICTALQISGDGGERAEAVIPAAIQAASDALLFKAMAYTMLVSDRYASQSFIGEAGSRCATALGSTLQLDLAGVAKEAAAEAKKALQAAVRAIKAEDKPTAPPPSEAAARGTEGAGTKTGEMASAANGERGKKAPAAAGKKKATAEETAQGIAAALQNLESAAPAAEETDQGDATAPQGNKATAPAVARPVMYRNPVTGETWNGRGKRPKWLEVRLSEGRTLDEYLVAAQTTAPEDKAVPTLKASVPVQGALAVGVVVGQRVKVLAPAGGYTAEDAGREGTVNRHEGNGHWLVKFTARGKTCEFKSYPAELLEPVE